MRSCLLLLAALCLTGCGAPSFLVTPVSSSHELHEETVEPGKGWSGDKIAILEVEGMLVNARKGGFLQPTENDLSLFTQQLDKAENDPAVKAVVLRVNSPGGTVTTSDNMYQMVQRFKAKTHKPVVASMQEVAASGAYYVSCSADQIVANPTTIVGSIGVIFETLNAEGTMQKLGLRFDPIKSGPLKDMGSPFKTMTPEERTVLQDMVNEYYKRFVGIVTSNRHITDPDVVAHVTDGRVFSGENAQKLGLVDKLGMLSDAIDLARDLSHSPNAKAVLYKRPYGYGGSIYAQDQTPQPQANVINLNLPGADAMLPTGFYYLWSPGE